ncbi:glycerate kinase [Salsuginibacillus kocurii]|uniref:glycerate kinase n=1 Tax=Salsuginibacillus kocurii TaxID=427078 RepID=UPI00036E5E34|nr:glycerate kinase [Salsuginibacillus kocurii]
MNIVIAPDSFKESLTAAEAASAIARGIQLVSDEDQLHMVPMADGGEGTVQSLIDATNGELKSEQVIGPLGSLITAEYGVSGDGDTAFIEMASASGLELVPPTERDPMRTTTYGTGQLIQAALDQGARHIILGIGGSATNDGGIGMAQALGASIKDEHGEEVEYGGQGLQQVANIDISNMDERLQSTRLEVACDVDNPLTGEEGASFVFGPQKGASEEMVKELDQAMEKYATVMVRDLGLNVENTAGAGAAGGLGAGLLAFAKAELKPGIDLVIKITGLESFIKRADLVITGEGRMDGQTMHGKTPAGVGKLAKKYDLPVFAIAGTVEVDYLQLEETGIDAAFSMLNRPMSLEDAIAESTSLLVQKSANLRRLLQFQLGMN